MSTSPHKIPEAAGMFENILSQLSIAGGGYTLSDPRQPDNPIVYASEGFFKLTGYDKKDVLGKNCRFLQGEGTSREAVTELRDAIREERQTTVKLLNYRKDGTPFMNVLHIEPVIGIDGVVELFIGVQYQVREDQAGEVCAQVEQEELALVDQVKEQVRQHSEEIHEQQTCVADHSLPSSLICGFGKLQESFVIADPNLEDCPMMYCSPNFLKLTGYGCHELLGVNCRILQGPGTDRVKVAALKEALAADPPRPYTCTLLNYKKSGEPFWNCLHISPVRDANGKVRFIVGVQIDVTHAAATPGLDSSMMTIEEGGGIATAAKPLEEHMPTPMMLLRQKGIVGAIRVATRSLSNGGLRRSTEDQHKPTTPKGLNHPDAFV